MSDILTDKQIAQIEAECNAYQNAKTQSDAQRIAGNLITWTIPALIASRREQAREMERLRAELATMTNKADRRKKGLDLTLSLLEGIAKAESLADLQAVISAGMTNVLILVATNAPLEQVSVEEKKISKATDFQPLADEIARAIAKHGTNQHHMLAALMEEVGEVAQAYLEGRRQDARGEALQVACVAWRIYTFGDWTFEPEL